MSKKQLLSIPLFMLLLLMAMWWWEQLSPRPYDPLPYRFALGTALLTPRQQAQALQASLLVIGDRHGQHFSRHLSQLPGGDRVLNLAILRHGIHRSLQKLQELPQLPEVVIFLGGFDEFYEEKFHLAQYSEIKKYWATLRGDLVFSLLATLPRLSPWIAPPPPGLYQHATELVPTPKYHDPVAQQRDLELRFKSYEWEVQQLIDGVARKGSTLILATAPIDLERPPRQVCGNASTPLLEQKLARLSRRLERGESKLAIAELRELEGVILGHARFHYILGQAYRKRGESRKARHHLVRANSFDCDQDGSSHVLNTIIRRKARQNGTPLIDLDEEISAPLGKRHYQYLLEQLAVALEQIKSGPWPEPSPAPTAIPEG